jgi:hypothetical protein
MPGIPSFIFGVKPIIAIKHFGKINNGGGEILPVTAIVVISMNYPPSE